MQTLSSRLLRRDISAQGHKLTHEPQEGSLCPGARTDPTNLRLSGFKKKKDLRQLFSFSDSTSISKMIANLQRIAAFLLLSAGVDFCLISQSHWSLQDRQIEYN